LAALWALTSTTDLCALFNRTRVNNAGIFISAERANHLGVSPFEILDIPTFRCIEWRRKTTL